MDLWLNAFTAIAIVALLCLTYLANKMLTIIAGRQKDQ